MHGVCIPTGAWLVQNNNKKIKQKTNNKWKCNVLL